MSFLVYLVFLLVNICAWWGSVAFQCSLCIHLLIYAVKMSKISHTFSILKPLNRTLCAEELLTSHVFCGNFHMQTHAVFWLCVKQRGRHIPKVIISSKISSLPFEIVLDFHKIMVSCITEEAISRFLEVAVYVPL